MKKGRFLILLLLIITCGTVQAGGVSEEKIYNEFNTELNLLLDLKSQLFKIEKLINEDSIIVENNSIQNQINEIKLQITKIENNNNFSNKNGNYELFSKRLENLEGKYIEVSVIEKSLNWWITFLLFVFTLAVGGTWWQKNSFAKEAKGDLKEVSDAKEKALQKIENLDLITDRKISEISKKAKKVHGDIIKEYEDQRIANEYLSEGIERGKEGSIEESIKYFDKSIKLVPEGQMAYYNKGISLSKLEKHEEAIKEFDKVIKINNKYPPAYKAKGTTLSKLRKYEEAIELFDKAIKFDKNYIDAYKAKGFSLINLEKHEEAIEQFDKVIELDDKDISAYINKGFCLDELKKYEEAIKQYDKVIELDDKDIFAYECKGFSLVELKKYKKAIEQFDKIIDLNSEDGSAYYCNACLYSLLNKEKESNEFLYKLYKTNYFENKADRENFYIDKDFNNIRNTKEFKDLVKNVKNKYGDK